MHVSGYEETKQLELRSIYCTAQHCVEFTRQASLAMHDKLIRYVAACASQLIKERRSDHMAASGRKLDSGNFMAPVGHWHDVLPRCMPWQALAPLLARCIACPGDVRCPLRGHGSPCSISEHLCCLDLSHLQCLPPTVECQAHHL